MCSDKTRLLLTPPLSCTKPHQNNRQGPVRFGPGVVVKGDVTLENPAGKVMDDYVTVSDRVFADSSYKLEPAVPAEAPAAAAAAELQPALA